MCHIVLQFFKSSRLSKTAHPLALPSSSSGAKMSLLESFGLLNCFLPFNLILDAFPPIIYVHYS